MEKCAHQTHLKASCVEVNRYELNNLIRTGANENLVCSITLWQRCSGRIAKEKEEELLKIMFFLNKSKIKT